MLYAETGSIHPTTKAAGLAAQARGHQERTLIARSVSSTVGPFLAHLPVGFVFAVRGIIIPPMSRREFVRFVNIFCVFFASCWCWRVCWSGCLCRDPRGWRICWSAFFTLNHNGSPESRAYTHTQDLVPNSTNCRADEDTSSLVCSLYSKSLPCNESVCSYYTNGLLKLATHTAPCVPCPPNSRSAFGAMSVFDW